MKILFTSIPMLRIQANNSFANITTAQMTYDQTYNLMGMLYVNKEILVFLHDFDYCHTLYVKWVSDTFA